MSSFTVHTSRAPQPASADDAVFIIDGWSWPALVFGPFWLAWHRQWLVLAAYVALAVVLAAVGAALGLPQAATSLLSLLPNIALALEGGNLRSWTLARAGRPAIAVVSAESLFDAEARFFAGLDAGPPAQIVQTPPVTVLPRLPARPGEVMGLFPQQGGR